MSRVNMATVSEMILDWPAETELWIRVDGTLIPVKAVTVEDVHDYEEGKDKIVIVMNEKEVEFDDNVKVGIGC